MYPPQTTRQSFDESSPLLAGQLRRPEAIADRTCSCNGCATCLKEVLNKLSENKGWKMFVAGMGATTAINGALKATELYTDNIYYGLIMALIAWGTATATNYTANPKNNIKTELKAGIPPQYQSYLTVPASATAAISSGFLAIATPFKLYNILLRLMNKATLSSAGWPLIIAGIIVLIFNTWTSWHVGNTAAASFTAKYKRVADDFKEHPAIAATALAIAIFTNIIMLLPYSDGIADGLGRVISTDGDFKKRLETLFFSTDKIPVSSENLYRALYWTFFGVSTFGNLVALSTFTFMPTYELFFDLITKFSHIQETLATCNAVEPGINERVKHDPLWSKLALGTIACVFTFAYSSAFGGFAISTLESYDVPDTSAKGIGITSAAVTWGPLLYTIVYNMFRKPGRASNKYHVMLRDYATYLYNYVENVAPTAKDDYSIQFKQDENSMLIYLVPGTMPRRKSPTLLYRANQGLLVNFATDLSTPDKLNRSDIVELMGEVFTPEQLTALQKNSLESLRRNGDGKVTDTVDYTVTLHQTPGEPIKTAVFEFTVTYYQTQQITLEMVYNPTVQPAHIAININDDEQETPL